MQLKPSEVVAAVVIIIFIVAVLGLGLYPSLREAPTKQCLANLKNVGTAISLYVGEAGGLFPPSSWVDALGDQFIDRATSLVCPAARPTREQLEALRAAEGRQLPIGYSLFKPAGGGIAALLAGPEKTPIVFDSSDIRPNSSAGLSALAFRHAGKQANILFTDGHSESVTSAPDIPRPLFRPPGETPGDEGP